MRATRKWSGRKVHAEINDWQARRKSQSVTREERGDQFAILAMEAKASGILAEASRVEKVLRAGDCASLSGTLDSHICYAVAWRGGIEYFIMANDRFINSNLSAIKSRPPSLLPSIPLHMKGRTTLRLLGRVEERGGVTRQLEREGPKPNLRAKRINDGRIDRGSAMNGRADDGRFRERER